VVVASAVSFFEQIEYADAERTFFDTDTEVIHCEK
jgi:hypothetical protein